MHVRRVRRQFLVSKQRWVLRFAAVSVTGALGMHAVGQSGAATFVTSAEAESGQTVGNAGPGETAAASGGASIRFGPNASPPSPPPSGSCAATGLHVPDGPDGMGGCWPGPGNTGVPDGTQLTAYTGPCTITAVNAVIDSKTVNCTLDIRATGVTITKSHVNGAIYIDDTRCGTASFTVSDSTIFVNDINLRGLMRCSYTALRVDVSGGQSMAWCASCTIQDSYLHNPLEDPEGAAANRAAHNSTVRMAANAVIRHNTLWCHVKEYPQPDGQDTSGCSANQTGYSHDGAPPFNSRVEANLYMPTSGGYCAYGGSTTGATSSVNNIVFKDNIFKRGPYAGQGGPNCGVWGPITSFDSSRPGNQWTNNRWEDGTPVQASN